MKTILDTELVQIRDTDKEYQVLIRMSAGGVLEHEPFERDLRGLIAALQLATEVCAGKFFPKRVVEIGAQYASKPRIEHVKLKLPKGDV